MLFSHVTANLITYYSAFLFSGCRKESVYNEINVPDNQHIMSDEMSKLLEKKEYSDVTLRIDGQEIFGHKAILAARSSYFHAMFASHLKESSQKVIELEGFSYDTIQAVVYFMYTGQTNFESKFNITSKDDEKAEFDSNIEKITFFKDLLQAADFFDLRGLSKLIQQTISNNCLSIYCQKEFTVEQAHGYTDLFIALYDTADNLNLTELQSNIAYCSMSFKYVFNQHSIPVSMQSTISRVHLLENKAPLYFGKNHQLYTLLTQEDLSHLTITNDILRLVEDGADFVGIFAGHELIYRACLKQLFSPEMGESIWLMLENFFSRDYPINSLDYHGKSMLHIAALHKKEDLVQRLLSAGANPHCKDINGISVIDDIKQSLDTDLAYYICLELMDHGTQSHVNMSSILSQHQELWIKSRNIINMVQEAKEKTESVECESEKPDLCLGHISLLLDQECVEQSSRMLAALVDENVFGQQLFEKQMLKLTKGGWYESEFHSQVLAILYPNFMELLHNSTRSTVRTDISLQQATRVSEQKNTSGC